MLVDMRKNTLFKHMLLIVICEVMLMLSACDRKSVDDLYNMTETSIEDDMQFLESVSDWKEVKEEYATWGTTEDKPELVQQGDSCTVSLSGIEGTSTLTFQVENTILSDDFFLHADENFRFIQICHISSRKDCRCSFCICDRRCNHT